MKEFGIREYGIPECDTLDRISRDLAGIVLGHQRYTALDIGISLNRATYSRLIRSARPPGYLVGEHEVTEWHPKGYVQHDRRVFLYGPSITGVSLSEVLHTHSDEVLARRLSHLVRAAGVLLQNGREIPPIHTRCVYFTDNNGVLFLDPDAVRVFAESETFESRREHHDYIRHPDKSGEDAFSHALGVMMYYGITGRYPYTADNEHDLNTYIRKRKASPVRLYRPELRPEPEQFLEKVLDPHTTVPSLQDWNTTISRWIGDGLYQTLSEHNRLRVLKDAEKRAARQLRCFSRTEYLRRNGLRLFVTLAAVTLIGSLPYYMIMRTLQPRTTDGLAPEEVIEAYFSGMNNLDHEVMSDATIRGSGKQDIDEVVHLFVSARVRYATEMNPGYIPADRWRAEGMPELPPDTFVYGVADLQIEPCDGSSEQENGTSARTGPENPGGKYAGPEDSVFLVRYTQWKPVYTENTNEESRIASRGRLVEQKLYMTQNRGDWVIYRFETLSEAELGTIMKPSSLLSSPQ
jgi:hypothetical protein